MPEEVPAASGGERICVVRRGDRLWGVPGRHSKGIARIEHLARMPRAPGHLLGVAHHRGAVLAVVDLAGPLGLAALPLQAPATALLVEAAPLRVAVAVDEVVTFEALAAASTASPRAQPYVAARLQHPRGVVALLDVEALLLALKIQRPEASGR